MIDREDRAEPRFPAGEEATARTAIREAIAKEQERVGAAAMRGIAGGANGGDILFHEVCRALGIPTEVYLALPREQYLAKSVAFAGEGWVDRFDRLLAERPVHLLSEAEALPGGRGADAGYTVWQRANLWMLREALAAGGAHTTLIALWNGSKGDGPGGTEDLVRQARKRGARTVILDTNALFDLPEQST